jgi:hypothetical protein
MVKFDDVLTVQEDGAVIASGPVDSSKEDIVELCAWVFQRGDSNDLAATEMTHHDEHGAHHLLMGDGELVVEGNQWRLPISTVGEGPLEAGMDAFAVAVAMIKEDGKQRVVWWGHPVELRAAAS